MMLMLMLSPIHTQVNGTSETRIPESVAELLPAAAGKHLTIHAEGYLFSKEELASLDAKGLQIALGSECLEAPHQAGEPWKPGCGPLPLGRAIASVAVSDRPDGLFVTCVTDEFGVALGVCYSSAESVEEGVRRAMGAYWSRKRGLWVKGLTSGHTQELLSIGLDCDRDAFRFSVVQSAPGFCHLDAHTCWGTPKHGLPSLGRLLEERKASAPAGSYTKRLFEDSALLRAKLLEEAEELADAVAKDEGHDAVAFEAADVMYFALTHCVKYGVSLADVERSLHLKHLKVSRRKGDAKKASQFEAGSAAAKAAAAVENKDASVPPQVSPLRFVREDLKSVTYSGVPSMSAIAAEVGLPVESLVKLDANENPYGAKPAVRQAMTQSLLVPPHVYPG